MRSAISALLGAALVLGLGFSVRAADTAPDAVPAVAPSSQPAPGPAKPAQAKPVSVKSASIKPDGAAPTADATPGDAAPDDGVVDASGADDVDADGIVATVNDESISDFEVRQRMALFIATSGIKPTEEDKTRIRGQIISQLEDEKMELQEARNKKITVSPTEVDKRINALVSENHITPEQLQATLQSAGSNIAALRAQFTASIAWQKTVQQEYVDRVVVTPADVEAEYQRIRAGANKTHFLVGEIFLPVDAPEDNDKVHKAALDVAAQLQRGASFQGLARQLSQSPSAAAGGDMGWLRDGQLAPELNNILQKMPVGVISQPVRGAGGWYLLALRERQEPAGTDVTPVNPNPVYPEGSLPLARLLLPLGEHPTKELIESAMKIANEIRGHVVSCQGMDSIAKEMKGSVYMDLGVTKLSDLSTQIQTAIAATHEGDTAVPFISDAGVEIIGRCDKRPRILTAFHIPTHEEVEQQLFEDQISALANRYKRDLKRSADIEVR